MELATWPFTVGMLGGTLFGVGALAFALATSSKEPSQLALFGLGGGALLLGIAWAAVLRMRGAFGAMLGSFAVPLSFFVVFLNRNHLEEMRAMAMLVAFALIAISAGHAFVRGLGFARVFAAHTAVVLTLAMFATDSGGVLVLFAAIGLIGMGVTLPFGWMKLRTWQDDETRL